MSTITIELDNLTAEEQETVKRLAEKNKEPYRVPEKGEEYFAITEFAYIESFEWCDDRNDNAAFVLGNCFRTEEEAKEAITRLQMQTKWKRLSLEAGEAKNPWDCNKSHFYAYWDCAEKRIDYSYYNECIDGVICFPTKNSLKAAIAELGEENVKKYILGVEEWQN